MGSAANAAIKQFSSMGSGLASVAGLGGAAVAGLGAVAAGAIGVALHTAESTAKLNQLSQATGVSVEALSGLGFVSKQVGVDQETLATGLERMSKLAFAAATAPAGAVNAYTRLGVAVRDASGQIRSTESIFTDLAAKFAAMPDGISKSALAMQIFGCGGAAMIPVLNLGRAGVEGFLKTAQRLGVVMDTETAQALEQFEQKLNLISAAAQGASNTLLHDLLPAMQAVAAQLTQDVGGETWLQRAAHDAATLAKIAVGAAETLWNANLEIIAGFRLTEESVVGALASMLRFAKVSGDLLTFDFSSAGDDAKKGLKDLYQPFEDFGKRTKALATDTANFWKGAFGSVASETATGTGGQNKSGPDTSPLAARSNAIAETIAKLIAQENAEGRLANAISSVTANTILATAAAEAQKDIDELEVRAARQRITVAESEKSTIRDVVALTEAYKAAYEDNKAVENFVQKTQEEVKVLGQLADAYGRGARGVEEAEEAAKVAPFQKQADDLSGVIEMFHKLGTLADLTSSLERTIAAIQKTGASAEELAPLRAALDSLKKGGVSGDPLAPLEHAYDELKEKINAAKEAAHQLAAEQEAENFAKVFTDISRQADEQQRYTIALLAGAAAQREYKIASQVTEFANANPLLSRDSGGEIEAYRAKLEELGEVERVNAAAEKVAQSETYIGTLDQIQALEELRGKEIESGADTTATDNLIHSEQLAYITEYARYVADATNAELLGNAKLYDSQQELLKQWDDAALKVGTLTEKFRAFLNELNQEGQNLGASLFGDLNSYIGSVEDQLAKLVVTGKANFQKIAESFEESLVKSTIQKGVSSLSGGVEKLLFGEKFPGEKESKLGTQGNPMYVHVVNPVAGAGSTTIPLGGPNSSFSGFPPGSPATPPFLPPSVSAAIGAPQLAPASSSLSSPVPGEDKPDGSTSTNALYTIPVDESGNAIVGAKESGNLPFEGLNSSLSSLAGAPPASPSFISSSGPGTIGALPLPSAAEFDEFLRAPRERADHGDGAAGRRERRGPELVILQLRAWRAGNAAVSSSVGRAVCRQFVE